MRGATFERSFETDFDRAYRRTTLMGLWRRLKRAACNFGGTFHTIEDRQRVRNKKDRCEKGGDSCATS